MKNTVAILIDCWQGELTGLHSRILNWLDDNLASLDTVILASYWTEPRELFLATAWHQSARARAAQFDWQHRPPEVTDPSILAWTEPSVYQTAMQSIEDFQRLIQEREQITRVMLMGSSWDGCVEHRPLGWRSLAKNTELDIDCHCDLTKPYEGSMSSIALAPEWQRHESGLLTLTRNK